jgi:hypothetical protein
MKKLILLLAAVVGLASPNALAAAHGITTEDRANISDVITRLVWSGCSTKNDIRDAAIYEPQPSVQSPEDLEWLDKQIEVELAKKRSAEATWPSRTNFDRLDDVFKILRSAGILAMHNAGNRQSDAEGDARDEWDNLGGPESGLKGFVFYHNQDVERVVESGDLYIGFSTFPGSTIAALELAQKTALELQKAGFTVTVPSNVDTRILVTGVDWKKRSPK